MLINERGMYTYICIHARLNARVYTEISSHSRDTDFQHFTQNHCLSSKYTRIYRIIFISLFWTFQLYVNKNEICEYIYSLETVIYISRLLPQVFPSPVNPALQEQT